MEQQLNLVKIGTVIKFIAFAPPPELCAGTSNRSIAHLRTPTNTRSITPSNRRKTHETKIRQLGVLKNGLKNSLRSIAAEGISGYTAKFDKIRAIFT
ncbi:MAG: hypothetical protein RL224_903 [Actinomycetota bacterium]|jgi:hypothetical protein